jgi:hypothetical protein
MINPAANEGTETRETRRSNNGCRRDERQESRKDRSLNMHRHYLDGEPGEAAVVRIQVAFRLVESHEYGVVEEETLSDIAGRGHRGLSSSHIQTLPPSTSLDTSAASPCGCYYKN